MEQQQSALPWAMIQSLALEAGFAGVGVADIDLADAEPGLRAWLAAGYHGTMDYMARHGMRRARPAELVPGTVVAIMVTLDYRPRDPEWRATAWGTLAASERAYVSRYALGRDYHKVVRQRLARLVTTLAAQVGPMGARVFCDSAPVMEVELARRAGLGWRGKHTLLLSRDGSMRFIGTIYVDRPVDMGEGTIGTHGLGSEHCGQCQACLQGCPTGAIVAPGRVDARRCISYLTIEHRGAIPEQWRPAIGNRIYGCDDCQLVCPWNRFAQAEGPADFQPRNGLDTATLLDLFQWTEAEFNQRMEGSAIRRIGQAQWQRNIAVAMGNALRGHAARAMANTSPIGEPVEPEGSMAVVTPLSGRASGHDTFWFERPGAVVTPLSEQVSGVPQGPGLLPVPAVPCDDDAARAMTEALQQWLAQPPSLQDPIVAEHVRWALEQGTLSS